MEITNHYQDKSVWNKFITAHSRPASFLQSWEWGEFNQQVLGHTVQRWAVIDNDKLQAVLTLIKKPLPLGKFFWYCPRGPVCSTDYLSRLDKFFPQLLSQLKNQLGSAVFLRLCPPITEQASTLKSLKKAGWQAPKILTHLQEPAQTLVLDLTKNSDELLAAMHHKTRYNIRLAAKKGVQVYTVNQPTHNEIKIFNQLLQTTGRRNKIKIHPANYYRQLIEYFSQAGQDVKIRLYQAKYQDQVLASALMVYFGHTATYLHGASGNQYRQLMPNHLLQWQMIQDAQQAGYQLYDFWGISQTNPQWSGISRFKQGFGGQVISFLGAWDYVLNPSYYQLFSFLKLIKKLIP